MRYTARFGAHSVTFYSTVFAAIMTFTGLIGRICLYPLELIIRTCVALRIHPNTLTFIGVLINFAAAWALALGRFVIAGVIMVVLLIL
jgi:hypothetical protein